MYSFFNVFFLEATINDAWTRAYLRCDHRDQTNIQTRPQTTLCSLSQIPLFIIYKSAIEVWFDLMEAFGFYFHISLTYTHKQHTRKYQIIRKEHRLPRHNDRIRQIRIWFYTARIIFDIPFCRHADQIPFARHDVFWKVTGFFEKLEVDLETIVRPTACRDLNWFV